MIAMQTRFDKPRGRFAAVLLVSFALAASEPTGVRADSDLDATLSNMEQAWELAQHERLRHLTTFRRDHLAPFVSDGCSGGHSAI